MADNFFGLDTSLGVDNLDDGLDSLEDEDYEEGKYDALNDETFGSESLVDRDWEQDHEKLAEITESTRPHLNSSDKNGPDLDIDVEDSLSHLVLDEKDGIKPRPGVWDSPSLASLAQSRPKPSLASTLKNACTVEELERGLIANRSDDGFLGANRRNHIQQLQHSLLNGLPPTPRFPPGMNITGPHTGLLPPNVRLPPPQFLQNLRPPTNQSGNMMRYPLPPHLMMSHGPHRQPFHNNFPLGNFHQQQNNPNLPGLPFMRPERPMLPFFSNNLPGHQQHLHPAFGPNQRNNQNRPFHQNDQPFFKNNQPFHQNQRHQQHYNHGYHGMNGLDRYDEYAGLMSSREKQWLVNIQLLQLNTNQPYIDDYYFTVFCDRENKKNEKSSLDKNQQNNNGYHKDAKDREQPTFTRASYVPAQFENSLGKLQFGSVTAPRKIIDMDIVPNSEPQSSLPVPQKDTKKTRQLLLEIERLYILQLKLEDINNPLAVLAEQQQQQQETETEPKVQKKTLPELCSMIITSFLQLQREDKLASMLSIRKGKTLLLRFLPYLSVTEYTIQLRELWTSLLRGLALIGRRDSNLLISFFSEFRRWIQTVDDFPSLLFLARAFTESANQPLKNNSLAFALGNKFGISVIASMLEQAEELFPSEEEQRREWSSFVTIIVDVWGARVPSAAPCVPIAANTLNQHLGRIKGLPLERFEPLEILLTDANPAR